MKKFISIFLLTTLISNLSYSQPLRYEETDWDIESQPIDWKPAPVDAYAGDLKLKVWILHTLVPAPEPGYLISKSDWIEVRRMLDGLNDELDRVKKNERLACDQRLDEKDEFCKELNKELRDEIDKFKLDIKQKNIELVDLEKENLWTKIITGTAILGLSALSIYQATK